MFNPYEAKIPTKNKLLYASGSFGSGFLFTLVSSFYMFYLTQVQGLSGTIVGTFFLIARLWDAINDPIMGAIVTNTRTRFGKYRLWMIIGCVLTAITLVLMFSNVNMNLSQKYQYYLSIYIIWGMAFTLVEIPYWSLIPVMTKNETERSSISAMTQILNSISTVFVSILVPISLISIWGSQNNSKGYFIIALVVAVLYLGAMLTSALTFNEKRTLVERRYSIKSMFFAFKKNDQAISMFAPVLLLNIAFGLVLNLGIYFFSFDFGDPTKQSVFMIIAGIGMALAVLSYTPLSKIIGRKTVFVLSCSFIICGLFLMFFFNQFMHGNLIYLSMGAMVGLFGFGWINVARVVMAASVCDYAYKKTGQRMDSLWVSVLSFSGKLGTSLVALIIGIVLDVGGFVGKDATVDVVSVYGINLLRLTMFIVPAVLVVFALVTYVKFYRLDNKKISFYYRKQYKPKVGKVHVVKIKSNIRKEKLQSSDKKEKIL
ncbi:MAG: glycoside-pentoside-hexuronide (GPH):cation symporter [Clostridia bacterium]